MISVILIQPETAGNIGAVARAMKNFGYNRLVLVSPKCDHLSKEAMDRASHAKDILKKAKIMDFRDIKADYLVATTSKLGSDYNMPRVPITPEQLAGKIKPIKADIGLVFGRESSGLTNEEIKACDFVVSIPVSKRYPAMNLSHSVAVILYSLFSEKSMEEKYRPIGTKEKEHILGLVDEVLDKLEFSTEEKKETQRTLWKRMVSKSFMTRREAFALMGFLKKLDVSHRSQEHHARTAGRKKR